MNRRVTQSLIALLLATTAGCSAPTDAQEAVGTATAASVEEGMLHAGKEFLFELIAMLTGEHHHVEDELLAFDQRVAALEGSVAYVQQQVVDLSRKLAQNEINDLDRHVTSMRNQAGVARDRLIENMLRGQSNDVSAMLSLAQVAAANLRQPNVLFFPRPVRGHHGATGTLVDTRFALASYVEAVETYLAVSAYALRSGQADVQTFAREMNLHADFLRTVEDGLQGQVACEGLYREIVSGGCGGRCEPTVTQQWVGTQCTNLVTDLHDRVIPIVRADGSVEHRIVPEWHWREYEGLTEQAARDSELGRTPFRAVQDLVGVVRRAGLPLERPTVVLKRLGEAKAIDGYGVSHGQPNLGLSPVQGLQSNLFQRFVHRIDARLQSVYDGRCLDVNGDWLGAPVTLRPCDAARDTQIWVAAGADRLMTFGLGLPSLSVPPGTDAVTIAASDDGDPRQKWRMESVDAQGRMSLPFPPRPWPGPIVTGPIRPLPGL